MNAKLIRMLVRGHKGPPRGFEGVESLSGPQFPCLQCRVGEYWSLMPLPLGHSTVLDKVGET